MVPAFLAIELINDSFEEKSHTNLTPACSKFDAVSWSAQ